MLGDAPERSPSPSSVAAATTEPPAPSLPSVEHDGGAARSENARAPDDEIPKWVLHLLIGFVVAFYLDRCRVLALFGLPC